jgi:transcriptional regulator with XRE-family HTH domain
LGEFVAHKRKRRGLTHEEFAHIAGVGLRFLREFENKKPTLQANKVIQVLAIFGYQLGSVKLNNEHINGNELWKRGRVRHCKLNAVPEVSTILEAN